jgi:hypothetical protein
MVVPLRPVYTIQVLHPSLHSRKLGSRKLEFKFVYTRCKKFWWIHTLRAHSDLFLKLNLLRSTIVHNNAIQREAPSSPPRNAILFVVHFYSIQVRSSFLIQVSCMVYTIKKLEFKKLEWRLGCKTCIVYTGL